MKRILEKVTAASALLYFGFAAFVLAMLALGYFLEMAGPVPFIPEGEGWFGYALQIIGGLIAVFTVWMLYRRTAALEKQNQLQVLAERNQRFKDAVELVKSNKPEVSIGGLHTLVDLAQEDPDRFGQRGAHIAKEMIRSRSAADYKKANDIRRRWEAAISTSEYYKATEGDDPRSTTRFDNIRKDTLSIAEGVSQVPIYPAIWAHERLVSDLPPFEEQYAGTDLNILHQVALIGTQPDYYTVRGAILDTAYFNFNASYWDVMPGRFISGMVFGLILFNRTRFRGANVRFRFFPPEGHRSDQAMVARFSTCDFTNAYLAGDPKMSLYNCCVERANFIDAAPDMSRCWYFDNPPTLDGKRITGIRSSQAFAVKEIANIDGGERVLTAFLTDDHFTYLRQEAENYFSDRGLDASFINNIHHRVPSVFD